MKYTLILKALRKKSHIYYFLQSVFYHRDKRAPDKVKESSNIHHSNAVSQRNLGLQDTFPLQIPSVPLQVQTVSTPQGSDLGYGNGSVRYESSTASHLSKKLQRKQR
jgi:hypothetical protein